MMARNDVGGTSTKDLLHWMQLVRTGKFQNFDYGSSEDNEDHYGTSTPPQYDADSLSSRLENVNILLFQGDNDVFT